MTWIINNTRFPFRRNLQVIASPEYGGVSAGHPVTVILSSDLINMNKVLEDFSNLVVTFQDNQIPRRVTQVGFDITVEFQIQALLSADEVNFEDYHIYYGSSIGLTQPSYVTNDWPVSIDEDNSRVSYTRPGEDWVNGISTSRRAKANFAFNGTKVRLIGNRGSNYGFAEIQLDLNDWITVDLYSPQFQANVILYQVSYLNPGDHALRIKATGSQNAGANDNKINIVRFDYMKNIEVIDLGEEVDDFTWSSSLGGM